MYKRATSVVLRSGQEAADNKRRKWDWRAGHHREDATIWQPKGASHRTEMKEDWSHKEKAWTTHRRVHEQESGTRGRDQPPTMNIDIDYRYQYKFRPRTCPERQGLTASAHEIGYLAFKGTRMALIGDDEEAVEQAIVTCGEKWPNGFHFADTAGTALQIYAGQMGRSTEERWDKVAVLMIAIPHEEMMEFIRQGEVERANPKSRTKGWNWKSSSGMTHHYHRMYIYEDMDEANEHANMMDIEDITVQARICWERRDVNNGAPTWWTMTWSKWCRRCKCTHDTKKCKP